jgi:hypothetical protein
LNSTSHQFLSDDVDINTTLISSLSTSLSPPSSPSEKPVFNSDAYSKQNADISISKSLIVSKIDLNNDLEKNDQQSFSEKIQVFGFIIFYYRILFCLFK